MRKSRKNVKGIAVAPWSNYELDTLGALEFLGLDKKKRAKLKTRIRAIPATHIDEIISSLDVALLEVAEFAVAPESHAQF